MQEIDMTGRKPELRKILVIGMEGAGKTNFIGTMPKPIYLFSFDKGFDTLAGMPGIKVGVCMDESRYMPKAYMEFKAQFDLLRKGLKYKWPDGREEAYKTIAIDSMSFLSTLLYDHEQKINNSIDKQGGFGVWGNVKSKLQDIVNQAVLASEYFVCTALLETTKDDITGEIFFVPSMMGSMKNEVGAWFDAVFYMTVDKNPNTGEKKYQMLTVGDRRQKAKIRLPSAIGNVISAVEQPSFESIMKKIDAAMAQSAAINEALAAQTVIQQPQTLTK